LESFTDRVVVRGPWWGPVMRDVESLEVGVERGAELGAADHRKLPGADH